MAITASARRHAYRVVTCDRHEEGVRVGVLHAVGSLRDFAGIAKAEDDAAGRAALLRAADALEANWR